MATGQQIRVFLLDDHEVVRHGLRVLLECATDIVVVGESGSAVEATARLPVLRPDVAVLDARLPDGSGLEVCRAVRSAEPSIRVLMLTSYDDDEALLEAVLAGAAGYSLKQIRGLNLVESVRQVASGRSLIEPALKASLLDWIRTHPTPELGPLTAQELSLLPYIAEGLTNRQIGERVLLAEQTVKSHISSILGKLDQERRTQAAVLADKLLDPPRRSQS